ncbi:MAG: UvrD-helicase domain-containing protein [Eggerthellaceae bacterium]
MDLSGFTPGQRQAITHLNGPLLVCAGAGTGKTFTLTQRIAFALVGDPENGIEPALESIDQALVITFTNKAAAELKSRFRGMLRSVGRFEDALKVDSAWISTIHGMCSRILREHALELGIDPEFKLVMGADQEDALLRAINLAIHDADGYERFQPLFDEYDTPGVKKMLKALIDAASCQTKGLDALVAGPEPDSTARMIYDLLDAAAALSIKGTKKTAESAELAVKKISDFIDQGRGEEEIPELIDSLGVGRLRGEAAAEMKEISSFLHDQAHMNKGRRLADLLFELARKVDAHYRDILHAESMIDTSSLIRTTLKAFDEHPEIARQYTERFKLIMVDEFQDTSQLQIDMIERISGTEHTHLCTVGDSQQSIYRFQGADVEVYLKHKADMEKTGALMVELQDNFRSHGDILSFVRCICSRPGYFIEDFLDLHASRRGGNYKGSAPRIELALTMHERGASTRAVETQANHIAMRFRQLIDEGHKPSDMAILMGSTTKMSIYAEALRKQGIPSMAAGGSKFYESDHIKQCLSLVRALANPFDSISMMDVLSSDILPVSSDDLLLISTSFDSETGIPSRQTFAKSFLYAQETPEGSSPLLLHAIQVFRKAWSSLGTKKPSRVFMGFLVDSGWIDRLQIAGQDGQAILADILKLSRIIEGHEEERCVDMAEISVALDASAESENEALGVLSVEGLQAVRLMTVHGSKGLQFPIVAVTDCYVSRKEGGSLALCADSSALYASLLPNSIADGKLKAKFELPEGQLHPGMAENLVSYRAKISEKNLCCSEAERRRLFYVAATRAEECLIIALTKQSAKSPNFKEIEADLLQSLFPGFSAFPDESGTFEYGGSEPGVYTRYDIAKEEPEEQQSKEDAPFARDEQWECENIASTVAQDLPADTEKRQTNRYNPLIATDDATANADSALFAREESAYRNGILIPEIQDEQSFEVEPVSPRLGFFSYSSLQESKKADRKEEDGCDLEHLRTEKNDQENPIDENKGFGKKVDSDKATDFGSAFHKTCEWIALQKEVTKTQIFEAAHRFAINYNLKDEARLLNALNNWLDSGVSKTAYAYSTIHPEASFCTALDEYLIEGEIDLLCYNNDTEALIIDYKTGGSISESYKALYEKHMLQAQCYAYAALSKGFGSVKLVFARVEQRTKTGIQTVNYEFTEEDLEYLKSKIRDILKTKQ